jgi:hypothetical protein
MVMPPAGTLVSYEVRGAPPNPVSLPSGSRYITFRRPFPLGGFDTPVGDLPDEGTRSSTKTVCIEWPAWSGRTSMQIHRCSASSHTASVPFGTKLGPDPSSRSYQARARG